MNYSRRQVLSSIGALLSLPAYSAFSPGLLRNAAPGCTEFLEHVVRGDLEAVRSALSEDAGLARATDGAQRSAFVLAHVHGHEDVAALLRDAGIELDIVEAVLAEDWERFEALAEEDPARLARAHPIGGTPLYAGALVGSLGFWRLRSQGCKPDFAPAGGSGFTASRGAMESPRSTWARIALTDLCSNGSDVNAPQAGGSSVLHGAVLRQDVTLVKLAVRKGARVDARDDEGRTPEELARSLYWEEGARLLANHASLPRDNRSSRFALDADGEVIERPDMKGLSQALQSQVTSNSHGNLAKVRELIATDKRLIFSISTDDELAIEASAHMGNKDLMRFHLDNGAPLSLPTAASLGETVAIEALLDDDPTLVHERGAHDFPVMMYAAIGNASIELAELLLERGVSVDQETMGSTTLHFCAMRGRLELAKWLIEAGADVNAVGYKWDRSGQTPLQTANARGQAAVAALLRDAGAIG